MSSWSVSISPEQLDRYRSDPGFAELMTLGRIANFLRAAMHGGFAVAGDSDSAADRQRTAMFLLLSGILAEALPVLERSGQHFRHLPSYASAIKPIVADPIVADLREQFLTPLRNQAVFHNDREVSRAGLASLRPGVAQDLARGSSPSLMDVYHPLADVVAVLFIIDAAQQSTNPVEWLSKSLGQSLELATRICVAIDVLVGEALSERGFKWG